jgi:hypothetical protein
VPEIWVGLDEEGRKGKKEREEGRKRGISLISGEVKGILKEAKNNRLLM